MISSRSGSDDRLAEIMPRLHMVVRDSLPRPEKGRVRRLLGVIVHATLSNVRVGEICHLVDPTTKFKVMAEVIGLVDGMAVLTPIGDLAGL